MFPGKPTGNLLPSLLGGTPQNGHTPGVSLSGSAQSYRPGMHFVEPNNHITTHTHALPHTLLSTLSVRPPTAGPKKHLYPFSGALYLCPLKYHLGRDSPTKL